MSVWDVSSQWCASTCGGVRKMNPFTWFGGVEDSGSTQVLWEDGERLFCRKWRDGADGDRHAILTVLLAAEHPTAESFDRLAHEYGLRDDLDEAWAVRKLEPVRERGQSRLVLKDPGGEPLDRLL